MYPKKLSFSRGEVIEFTLKVTLYPCPLSSLLGAMVWTNSKGSRRVVCPIKLYFNSSYDRVLWYSPQEDVETEEGKCNIKGKGKMYDDDEVKRRKVS